MSFITRKQVRRIAALVVLAAVGGAAPAGARDSHAPAGAPDRWLPDDEWVMSGWSPIDETRLQQLTGIDREELKRWLDNRRSLGRLVRTHGVRDLRAFGITLTAPQCAARRPRQVSCRELRRRVADMLSQPHLARHVLFHLYHSHALTLHTQWIFGLSRAEFIAARARGESPLQIATSGGIDEVTLTARLNRFFRLRDERGAREGAQTEQQAALQAARQRADMSFYIHKPYASPFH